MKGGWDYRAYEAYVARFGAVSGIPLVNSTDRANAGWGLRHLSASDFEKLEVCSRTDRDFNSRWLNRMQIGYDRERSQVAMEIEDVFSHVPCASEVDNNGEERAA